MAIENQVTTIAATYGITDNYQKLMLMAAFSNGVAEEKINSLLEQTKDKQLINARLMALISGIDDISAVEHIKDIKNQLYVEKQSEELEKLLYQQKENDIKVNECISCMLEFSEISLMLLEEVNKLKTIIENQKIEESLYNLSFKVLNRQNEMLEEMKSIVSKTASKEEETDLKKERNDDDVKREAEKEYQSVVARISSAPVTDVFDVFDLIRTGVFSDEQSKIISTAMSKHHLTVKEILEFAKPENPPETMKQLVEYLCSIRKENNIPHKKGIYIKKPTNDEGGSN